MTHVLLSFLLSIYLQQFTLALGCLNECVHCRHSTFIIISDSILFFSVHLFYCLLRDSTVQATNTPIETPNAISLIIFDDIVRTYNMFDCNEFKISYLHVACLFLQSIVILICENRVVLYSNQQIIVVYLSVIKKVMRMIYVILNNLPNILPQMCVQGQI